jgi:chromosome segregation ATPase
LRVNLLALVPDPVSADVAARDSVATSAHLIGLIEKQPACLMRVGLDGVLLAVNDAALSLLGATQLGQVLGTMLMERLGPEHSALWCDFAGRVWQDASGSVECDMVDLSGVRRTVEVQSVALADHPDGIRSVLAAVRDVSATRRLELALQEVEKTRPGQETAHHLTDELRVQLEGMRAQLDAALAERTDTARAMDALRAQLEQSLADRQEFESSLKQREGADRLRLETTADQDKADRERLESAVDRHDADRQRLEAAIEQRDAHRRQLQSTLDESLAERQEFESAVKQRAASRQRLLAEHASARVRVESALAEAASRNEQLTQLLADQGLDLQRTEENARRLEALATAGQLALDAALAERTEASQAMDALRAQLERSSADRVELETAADQDKADRQRLESMIEQGDADRQRLESTIGQRDADRRQLESTIEQRDADRRQLESTIEQRDADRRQLESTIEQRDADRRHLQSTLDESLAERQEFELAVKQRAANRQRLLSEQATARVRVESALAEATSRNDQLTKLLADQGLDLQRTEENARRLESLAAAGRVALDVARELQTIVGELDARTKDLLAECPLEADAREDVEGFRSAAIRAASLARQIVQAERIA